MNLMFLMCCLIVCCMVPLFSHVFLNCLHCWLDLFLFADAGPTSPGTTFFCLLWVFFFCCFMFVKTIVYTYFNCKIAMCSLIVVSVSFCVKKEALCLCGPWFSSDYVLLAIWLFDFPKIDGKPVFHIKWCPQKVLCATRLVNGLYMFILELRCELQSWAEHPNLMYSVS